MSMKKKDGKCFRLLKSHQLKSIVLISRYIYIYIHVTQGNCLVFLHPLISPTSVGVQIFHYTMNAVWDR